MTKKRVNYRAKYRAMRLEKAKLLRSLECARADLLQYENRIALAYDKERALDDAGDSYQIPPEVVREIREESRRFWGEVKALLEGAIERSFTPRPLVVAGGDRGRCRSCRWWGRPAALHSRIDGVTVLECQSPMVIQPAYGERGNRAMRPDGVLTCDEGGMTGELMTGPRFGCVHHEPRK
jgi:hypothetical protein